MAKADNRTVATAQSADDFLEGVDDRRRDDAQRLDALFREGTGYAPRMWGATIVGYGQYHYRYESGREGVSLATGFAVRKADLVLYIMPGYAELGDMLDRLGKHRKGKACLYLKRLSDIDEAVLREIIVAGLADLATNWTVSPT